MYKLFVRKAKCARCLNKSIDEILSYYNKALERIEKGDIKSTEKENVLISITKDIEDVERNIIQQSTYDDSSTTENYFELFSPNSKYPALSKKVTVDMDNLQGRYIKATADIKAGEIVAFEKPFSSVLSSEHLSTHCYHCKVRCSILIPCKRCTTIVFCSVFCRNESEYYHRIECPILKTIYSYNVSVNAHLAFRAVTCNTEKDFIDGKYLNQGALHAKTIYKHNDYAAIYNLCNHAEARDKKQFLDYTFVSVLLLRLLKHTDYFEHKTCDTVLTKNECLIGSLILRHLQTFEFNAHEIAEVIHHPEVVLLRKLRQDPLAESFYTESIGAAVYATLSLFNHSCDPSVARYIMLYMVYINLI